MAEDYDGPEMHQFQDWGANAPDLIDEYRNRLADSYNKENQALRGLANEQETQLGIQGAREKQANERILYGNAVGQGAAGLRGATYANSDMRQGVYNQQHIQSAINDQAYLDYLRQLRQRGGDYALMGQAGETQLYGLATGAQAGAYEHAAYNKGAEATDRAASIGLVAGGVGAGISAAKMGSGSDVNMKQKIKSARYLRSDERLKDEAYEAGRRKGAQEMQNEVLEQKWEAEGGNRGTYVTNHGDRSDREQLLGHPAYVKRPGHTPMLSYDPGYQAFEPDPGVDTEQVLLSQDEVVGPGRTRPAPAVPDRAVGPKRIRDFWDDSYDVMTLQSPHQERNKMRLRRLMAGYEGRAQGGMTPKGAAEPYAPYVPGPGGYVRNRSEMPRKYYQPAGYAESDVHSKQAISKLGRENAVLKDMVAASTAQSLGQGVITKGDILREAMTDPGRASELQRNYGQGAMTEPDRMPGYDPEWDAALDDLDYAIQGGDPRAIAVAQGFVDDYVRNQTKATRLSAALDREGARTMSDMKAGGPVDAGRRYAAEPAMPESEMGWTGDVPRAPRTIDLDQYQAEQLATELEDEDSLTMAALRGSGPIRSLPMRRDPRGMMLEEKALLAQSGEDPYEGY